MIRQRERTPDLGWCGMRQQPTSKQTVSQVIQTDTYCSSTQLKRYQACSSDKNTFNIKNTRHKLLCSSVQVT